MCSPMQSYWGGCTIHVPDVCGADDTAELAAFDVYGMAEDNVDVLMTAEDDVELTIDERSFGFQSLFLKYFCTLCR